MVCSQHTIFKCSQKKCLPILSRKYYNFLVQGCCDCIPVVIPGLSFGARALLNMWTNINILKSLLIISLPCYACSVCQTKSHKTYLCLSKAQSGADRGTLRDWYFCSRAINVTLQTTSAKRRFLSYTGASFCPSESRHKSSFKYIQQISLAYFYHGFLGLNIKQLRIKTRYIFKGLFVLSSTY